MNKNQKDQHENEETTGSGGQTGEIHFRYHDVLSDKPRDDALPPAEMKRLKAEHELYHKGLVDKQKQAIKERAAMKEGKVHYNANNYGIGQGGANNFKQHWINKMAQFSGRDKQVTSVPTNNEANTNDNLKQELDNKLRYRPGQKFNPKPQMR